MFIALFILGVCVMFLGFWVRFEKKRPAGVLVIFIGAAIYVASFFFRRLDATTRRP
jgi:ABC-type Mn2+/Zn2+ transport system permease subunit